ncbi:MAG: ArsC/Spx/MgsR family protein [Gammaproteobacteria bacterium]
MNAVGLENLINKRSTTFRQLSDIEKNNINNDLIQKNPTLIKRPLIVNGSEIHVGFKEEFFD